MNVRIGTRSHIGIGANIIMHGVTIGQDSIVGAAALLTKNLPNEPIANGIPARIVRESYATDKYY